MLTAKDNSYYLFKGWYTDAAGTTPVSNITYNGTTYTYTDHNFPIIASNNNIYSGTNTVKTDNYYAKYEERPATWQIKYGSSATGDWPGVVTMTNSSGSTFTGSLTLTHGQEIWLKIYDFKTSKWYGNGGDYADYIKTTLVSNSTLSTSGGNIHLKSAFAGNATFSFSFNSSTKQLTITQSGTVPNVTLWNNTSDGGTGNHITMTRSSTSSNVMTCTKTISEGENIYFKINDQSSSVWYTNATAYNEYTKKSIIDSAVMSTSGNNMRIHGHAGTYTFSFDYVTKKLSVSAAYSNIVITLDSTQVSSWISGSSAKIYYVSTNDEDGLHWEQMTASNSNKTYTVSVPSNYANNTQFLRRNSDNNTTWNYWPASETYRGFNKKFTISSSDGNNHSGSWGN